ncbi:MAG: hypothetical protein HZA92_11895 [Verrucomicrobia bacterium]|nr:hypothetical protein [Verrucomicrobiota bacterium]
MSWLRHWKVVLALFGLFLLGAATGTVITLKVVKHVIEGRTNPERMSQSLLHEFQRRLHLTPEQVERIGPILQRTGREMGVLRTEMAGRTFQVIRLSHEEIAAELLPEQREEFARLNKEMRERYRQQGPPGQKGIPPMKGPGQFGPQFHKGEPRNLKEGR